MYLGWYDNWIGSVGKVTSVQNGQQVGDVMYKMRAVGARRLVSNSTGSFYYPLTSEDKSQEVTTG